MPLNVAVLTEDEKHLLAIALNARVEGPEATMQTLRFFTKQAAVDALEFASREYFNDFGKELAQSIVSKL